MINKLSLFFNSGHERSIAAKKNIAAMFVIKGLSIGISFLLVPMTLNYVNADTYGLWLTISSLVVCVSFFDIGLNNGLRNKFAEAKANNNAELAQRYVSTTYAMLILIFMPIMVLFLVVNRYIDWGYILNLDLTNPDELSTAMAICFSYFCFKFIFSTINIILIADQKPANAAFRMLCENAISLLAVFIFTKFVTGSLVSLCVALCVFPLLVVIAFNIILFKGKYKEYRPKVSKIDLSLLSGLFNLGFKFFIIQMTDLLINQMTSFIIMREYGALDVTYYQIAYKYFSVLLLVMTILVAPLWSATTEAYVRGDITWIKNISCKYVRVYAILLLMGGGLLLLSPYFYRLWIGADFSMPFSLSFWTYCYVAVILCRNIFVQILNGIGALKIQFYSSLVSPVVFICLCVVLVKFYGYGVYAVLIASIVANFNGFILAPIQYRQVFIKNKKGIWF